MSHGCWDIELQRFGGYDLNLLGSRAVLGHMTGGLEYVVSCGWLIWIDRFRDIKLQTYWGQDLDVSDSRDVIGHVTAGLAMCGFLLVVNMNLQCISRGCWYIELQKFWGHDLDLFGSRDVISHVTIGLLICSFLLGSFIQLYSPRMVEKKEKLDCRNLRLLHKSSPTAVSPRPSIFTAAASPVPHNRTHRSRLASDLNMVWNGGTSKLLNQSQQLLWIFLWNSRVA